MFSTKGRFAPGKFVRRDGGVTFEERGAQPSDFTKSRGYSYARHYAADRRFFDTYYPDWQEFADCFMMRRPVIEISGVQECVTESFKAHDIALYLEPGFQKVQNFRIPGWDSCSIPPGKYQLQNMSWSDRGNGMTDVKVKYVQFGPWKLIRLMDKVPSPGPGPGGDK